jgi:hypothetical protein
VSHILNQQSITTSPAQYQPAPFARRPKKLQRYSTTDEFEAARILSALTNHARRVQKNEFQHKTQAPSLTHYFNNNRIDETESDHVPASTHQKLEKKQYNFAYAVKDRYSGDDFSHTQKQENGAVRGSYKVRLPDNRIQTTKYVADDSGYRAEVTYEDDTQHHEIISPIVTAQAAATPLLAPQQAYYPQRQTNRVRYTVTPTPGSEYIQAPTIRKYYPSTTAIPSNNNYY